MVFFADYKISDKVSIIALLQYCFEIIPISPYPAWL